MNSEQGGEVLAGDVLGVGSQLQEGADQTGQGLMLDGGEPKPSLVQRAIQSYYFGFQKQVGIQPAFYGGVNAGQVSLP